MTNMAKEGQSYCKYTNNANCIRCVFIFINKHHTASGHLGHFVTVYRHCTHIYKLVQNGSEFSICVINTNIY